MWEYNEAGRGGEEGVGLSRGRQSLGKGGKE